MQLWLLVLFIMHIKYLIYYSIKIINNYKNLQNNLLLLWSNLSVIFKKTNIKLINNLNGYIKSGFCAIMGQSGSGKTTFLSALAKRISLYEMKIEGSIYINNN